MEAAGLALTVYSICTDIKARVGSFRKAPKEYQALLDRINLVASCSARLREAIISHPDQAARDDTERLETTLKTLETTVRDIDQDFCGSSSRRRVSQLFRHAIDTNRAEGYGRKLDELVAVLNSFASSISVGHIAHISKRVEEISLRDHTRQTQWKDGFRFHFHLENVPSTPHFQGRERYLDLLASRLVPDAASENTSRKVEILSGLGGMGKTQLAIQFAKNNEQAFSSIFFIDANSEESIVTSFWSIFHFLRSDSDYDTRRSSREVESRFSKRCEEDGAMIKKVLGWFCLDGNTDWLLIFDNVDRQPSHSGGVQLHTYFPPRNRGAILVTTRLNPLEIDSIAQRQIPLERLTTMESRKLIRAHMEGPSSDEEASSEESQILEKLDGLPLALAQASGFMHSTGTSATEYLELYETSRRKLLDSQRPVQGRDVASTWQVSMDHLRQLTKDPSLSQTPTRHALQLLQLMTYFDPADIDYDILRRGAFSNNVPGWFMDVFSSRLSFVSTVHVLTEMSLLQKPESGSIFSMHRLLHDWLCEYVVVQTEHEHIVLALSGLSLSCPGIFSLDHWRLEQQKLILHAGALFPKVRDWVDGGEHEIPITDPSSFGAFQAIHMDALDEMHRDWYHNLSWGAKPFGSFTGLLRAAEKGAEALDLVNSALRFNITGFRLRVFEYVRCSLLLDLERWQEAEDLCRRMIKIVGGQETLLESVNWHILLSNCFSSQSQTQDPESRKIVIQLKQEAVDRALGGGLSIFQQEAWIAVSNLVDTLSQYEEFEGAVALLAPRQAEAEEVSARSQRARSLLSHLARAYGERGEHAKQLQLLETSLGATEAAAKQGSQDVAWHYFDLARASWKMRDTGKTVQYSRRAVEIFTATFGESHEKLGDVLWDISCWTENLGLYEEATRAALQAAVIFESHGARTRGPLVIVCANLVRSYRDDDNVAESETWAKKGLTNIESVPRIYDCAVQCQVLSFRCAGDICMWKAEQDLKRAEDFFMLSYELAQVANDIDGQKSALWRISRLYSRKYLGNAEQEDYYRRLYYKSGK